MQFDQLKRREFITLLGGRGGGVATRGVPQPSGTPFGKDYASLATSKVGTSPLNIDLRKQGLSDSWRPRRSWPSCKWTSS